MRTLTFIILLLLTGCECDSICVASKETKNLLKNYSNQTEVVSYLQTYNGEGPGSEKFAVFVAWGVEHPEEFISIMNHQNITEQTLDLISYTISDIGYSKEYCEIYEPSVNGRNVATIRKAILGCKYNAL
ncbi:hypothetical protein ACJJI3_10345 [Microbulbifer sp. ZKSA004]|uniref:hypothetical protein n=1 Tax=Microbulbifer sp. ZKSA004 TaxID=3243389 RepID=UPI0040399F10